MANPNCSNVLNSYSSLLSNNPGNDTYPRPHPLFFSKADCAGSVYPAPIEAPIEGGPVQAPFHPEFGSLYIPPFWTVVLYQTVPGPGTVSRTICSSQSPLLITDTTSFHFNSVTPDCSSSAPVQLSNTSTKNSVNQLTMNSVVPISLEPYTTPCWAFDMCNSIITTNIGAQNLSSYGQGSLECDTLMTEFCKLNTGYTCRNNTRAGNNMLLPECACLADEVVIQETFCQPGNTSDACADAGEFQQFVPVTCFGKNCSVGGYRFSRMLSQKCTVTLCQQVLNVIGTDISMNTQSILYCGTQPSVTPTPTVTPNPNASTAETPTDPTPSWVYVVIAVFAMVFLIIVPLAFVLYQRSVKTDAAIAAQKMSLFGK